MRIGSIISVFTVFVAMLGLIFFALALVGSAENETASIVPADLAEQYNLTTGVIDTSLMLSGYLPYFLLLGILILIFAVLFIPLLRR